MIDYTSDTLNAHIDVHAATVEDIIDKDFILSVMDYEKTPARLRPFAFSSYPNMVVCSTGTVEFIGFETIDVRKLTLEQIRTFPGGLFEAWRSKVIAENPELFGIGQTADKKKK